MNPPQTPVAPKPSRTTHGLTGLIGLIIAEGELKGCLKETAKPSKAILHNNYFLYIGERLINLIFTSWVAWVDRLMVASEFFRALIRSSTQVLKLWGYCRYFYMTVILT